MGIQQSFMSCDDKNKKCTYKLTPYQTYNNYTNSIRRDDVDRNKKIREFVCGNNDGEIIQCCNKNASDADVSAIGGNLINPVLNSDGNIVEYQVCKCTSLTCEEIGCKGFRRPTNYEWCKARSVNEKDIISKNEYIDIIPIEKTYPNCYDNCK